MIVTSWMQHHHDLGTLVLGASANENAEPWGSSYRNFTVDRGPTERRAWPWIQRIKLHVGCENQFWCASCMSAVEIVPSDKDYHIT